MADYDTDDSSGPDGDSSGDEDADPNAPRPPRPARANIPAAQWANRYAANQARRDAARANDRKSFQRRLNNKRRDFIVLEFMENGDLASLIHKLVRETQAAGNTIVAGRVPNRVLWAFWLCRK